MRIVVGIDGSPQAQAGARWVAELPLRAEDDVRLVAVAQRPELFGGWSPSRSPEGHDLVDLAWEGVRSTARQALELAAADLSGARCPVHLAVEDGHPVEVLCGLAEEGADLVVVGPRGRTRLERLLLGSVSQGLLQAMPTAILIVREPVRAPARIVLATDGSEPSLAAARFIARLPLPRDVRIENVVVAEERIGLTRAEETARAEATLQATLAALRDGGRTGSASIRHGEPRRGILTAVREVDADLLVVGARGLGGFAGLVLGSVSRTLTKAAPCSVLVVPHRRRIIQ